MARYVLVDPVINSSNDKRQDYSITGREKFNPICPSFVTHGVTHNKKGPTAIAVSPCFKWSGREDLNLRPPAPKAGALARLRHAPIIDFCLANQLKPLMNFSHFFSLFYGQQFK